MTLKSSFAIAVTALVVIPMAAQAFVAENRVEVMPRAGSSFEVEPDPIFGVPGQWCAAADYAVRVLRAPWTNRVYVQGPGSVSRAVVFGMTPAGATPSSITSVSNSANTPGANFSVQRAFAFCINQRLPYKHN